MSFHGGFLGCVAAVMLFCRKNNLPILSLGDITTAVGPIGLFLGRHRQFHQQRVVGPAGRCQRALGDGVSQWRAAAAPSEPALRGGARGHPAVYDPGGDDPARRPEAAGPDPRQLHRDLRLCAHHRRIFPRARPAARIFVGRADHGYAAVGADDHCGRHHYCDGMAPQDAEAPIRQPRSKAGRDRIFAAAVRDQEADQIVRPDAGLALHGAVPDASASTAITCRAIRWAARAISPPRPKSARCSANCSGCGRRRSGRRSARRRCCG